MSNDVFGGHDKVPALSFKNAPIGTSYTGKVTTSPELVQQTDFETGEKATWPDGNPKMAGVFQVLLDDGPRAVWAAKPSALFSAIREAQVEAGAEIKPGGTITITFTAEEPNKKNPRLNAKKLYKVAYTPPNAFEEAAEERPF